MNAIKLVYLCKGSVTQSRIFVSNWDLFDFLEKLKASNDFDTLLIAAKTAPKIVETRSFMDGKLLKYLGIITHDDDKIPESITLFYKSGAKLQKISAPFFLFKELKKNEICDNPTAAFFTSESTSSDIAENIKLAEDAGFSIADTFVISEQSLKNGINRITALLKDVPQESGVIVFSGSSASLVAKLEEKTGRTILSRDDLIISIFNARAEGTGGKLKLASAVVAREKANFRKKITGLSRIKGGIGLKGPGETKEEERKRILKNKEKNVRKQLENEFSRLDFQRKFRKRSRISTIAIVGYTNAGKSTLFNALLNEDATKESNKFFSSIDPKIRKFSLFGKPLFLLDTVGFISNMSNDITDAFNSTFSEIAASDLILHIIDSTEKDWEERKKFVENLLIGNGCDKHNIVPLFSKKGKIKIKQPLRNGFFYDATDPEDITKIKKFLYEKLTEDRD
ncbi:50S ribosome-binding GTPase [bacterium]|nr:50S ribosome-binding GTPase [bacterium]